MSDSEEKLNSKINKEQLKLSKSIRNLLIAIIVLLAILISVQSAKTFSAGQTDTNSEIRYLVMNIVDNIEDATPHNKLDASIVNGGTINIHPSEIYLKDIINNNDSDKISDENAVSEILEYLGIFKWNIADVEGKTFYMYR